MIIVGSLLKVADNSGARKVCCIHLYKRKKTSNIGDMVLVTVRSYNPKKKIKKGEIFLALIIRSRYGLKSNNNYYKFNDNAVVLLNKKFLPLGSRIFGVTLRIIRTINKKVFLMIPNTI
jgi:large subunit ribosomal protein L14